MYVWSAATKYCIHTIVYMIHISIALHTVQKQNSHKPAQFI